MFSKILKSSAQLRISSKQIGSRNTVFQSKFRFSNIQEEISKQISDQKIYQQYIIQDGDASNIISSLEPQSEYVTSDLITKFSSISPSSIYEVLDEFSRTALFYVSNDLGWGLGISIVAISLGMKVVISPLLIATQLSAAKMKLIEPEMKNFQAITQRLQKQGDMKGMQAARKSFNQLREKHGISTLIPMLSLFQIPFLMTWFFSLRYVTNLPDVYPGLKTEGLLWFQDLSQYDPYFLLPILSACFSFYNIQMNPNMSKAGQGTVIGRYMKYFKFLPFVSIPIVGFFPAGLNLYWASMAFSHMIITLICKQQAFKSILGIPEYLPGTILAKMNQRKVQEVVKTFIQDVERQKPSTSPEAPIQTKPEDIQQQQKVVVFANKPKKSQDNQQQEVFANKPKKSIDSSSQNKFNKNK